MDIDMYHPYIRIYIFVYIYNIHMIIYICMNMDDIYMYEYM